MLVHFMKLTRRRRLLSGFAISSGVLGYCALDDSRWRQIKISSSGVVRCLRTLRIGATISLDYWFTNRLYPGYLPSCHLRCSNRILEGCLKNGGVYVKLGQGLVAMNHILPEEYLDTLEVLHDRALRELPFEEVEKIFLEDFGTKPKTLFRAFDEKCVAAASLAQVFRAQTEDGKNVAVKIQYGDLRHRFSGDVWTLGILVSAIGWMHPNYNFRWVLDYLRDSLVKELDFEIEAENMRKCAHDLSELSFIVIPKTIESLSSKRVLTMDWIDGIKINRKDELEKMGYSLHDIDLKLIKVSSQQVFRHGFLHADPHPGNILVVENPKKPKDPYLCLLDHGLYETLDNRTRLALCSLWKSIVYNDNIGMRENSQCLGVPENYYQVFCEMLVQRPLLFRAKSGVPLAKGLNKSEMKYMKDMALQRFDEIMACLKALPRPMLLVFRNINTVRSIAKTHGHPVDRFAVMAREAHRALFAHGSDDNRNPGGILCRLRAMLYKMVISKLIYSCQRLQLELFITLSWLIDWVRQTTQRMICYFNKDIEQAMAQIREKQARREHFFVE